MDMQEKDVGGVGMTQEILNKFFEEMKEMEKLERCIAKVPYMQGDGYADGEMVYDEWQCPGCGEWYEIDYNGKYNYCPKCGQKIDWSFMEELKTQFTLTEGEKDNARDAVSLLQKIRRYCVDNKCNVETPCDTISITQLTQMISFFNCLSLGKYSIEKD